MTFFIRVFKLRFTVRKLLQTQRCIVSVYKLTMKTTLTLCSEMMNYQRYDALVLNYKNNHQYSLQTTTCYQSKKTMV
jgi:hypothetical protein